MNDWTRVDVRLGALKANLSLLRSRVPDCRVLAAIKGNAYGHGLTRVAAALADVDALAVARLAEAQTLRNAGVSSDIVLMAGVLTDQELRQAIALECDLVVHTEQQVELLEAATQTSQRRVWLKVDTGMHRLGVEPEAVTALLPRLRRTSVAARIGLMTHLANADDTNDATTLSQFERFAAVASDFDGDVSIANSAALLGWTDQMAKALQPRANRDVWIRPGISLYGISPLQGRAAADFGLQPVMTFGSILIAVKRVARGERVGYGGSWSAACDTVIGIVGVGYGDGYPRSVASGAPVLVNGRRVPLAGTLSMDLLAVDLGPEANEVAGDAVTLWGPELPVEEIARHAQTTAYTLVTGVRDRTGTLV